jgi:hypothetical protein
MPDKEDEIKEAIGLASVYIARLPEGCPFYLCITESASHQEPGQLEIAPRTHLEYYEVAQVLNRKPETPEEIVRRFGALEIGVLTPPKGKTT